MSVILLSLAGVFSADAQECVPTGNACTSPEFGVAPHSGCCSGCCRTLLPSGGMIAGGKCVDASLCPAPTPTPLPSPPPEVDVECVPYESDFDVIDSCGVVSSNVRLGADLLTDDAVCLQVAADNVVIDGAGHFIRSGGRAIDIGDHGCVTIENVRSDQEVLITGDRADHNTMRNSQVGSVLVFGGDDNVIEDSTMTRFLAGSTSGIFPNAARRLVVRGNTIAGSQQALFRIAGGGDGYVNCARAEHQITGNEIVGLATEEEQVLFYYRCATHSTITDNVMRQEAPKGSGMLFRDEADHNLVGNNLVWVRETSRGVLRIESGNADKHHPRENVFRGNQFSTELGRALYLQAHEAKLNTFVQNLFASNAEWIEDGLRAGNYICGRENLFDHNTFHEGTGISLIIVDPRTWGPTTFKNNVFDHGGNGFLVDFRGSAELWLGNHNVYFDRGGAADFAEAGREMSFEEWLERSGEEESSIEGDPAYCDPAGGDYTLRTRSVAAEADETGDEAGSFPTSDHVCPDPTPPSTPEAPVPTPSPVVCGRALSACSGQAPPGTALPNDACCSGCCFVTVRSTAGFCVDESSCR